MNSKSLTLAIGLTLAVFAINMAQANPLNFYDDVSDVLDEVYSDESARKSSIRQQPGKFCKMPTRKGVCRALIPRWSYDPYTKECREFKFGGCDGNANNFATYKQCMQTCEGY